MDADARVPTYAELPILPGTDERYSWEFFGRDDSFGCLNFITPPRIVAATREVRDGRVVNLNLPVGQPQPQFWASREAPVHHVIRKRNIRDDYLDSYYTQGSTQWDGFAHLRYREHGYYGGRQEEDLDDRGELGIERWAERGIVGRGVLADVVGYLTARGRTLPPDVRYPIGSELLSEVLAAQNTSLEPGDILLVRTGWLSWYRSLADDVRTELGTRWNEDRFAARLPGIDPGPETVAWLWDHQVAGLAFDNPTVDTLPYQKEEGWAHHRLLVLLGLPFGELWDLAELAAVCQQLGRQRFLLTTAPMNIPGGVATPANAFAIL